jgi:nitronate monooxygenase
LDPSSLTWEVIVDNSLLLNRRGFLLTGGTAAAGIAFGCTASGSDTPILQSSLRFHTEICNLLGIRYPILQSGMGGVSGVELAAAVSQSGGLGIIAGGHLPPDEVRNRIHEVRRLTDKPFGVNLLLHSEMWPPVDASLIPDSIIHAVQSKLNRFRRNLGLESTFSRPETRPDYIDEAIEVILEERVPVFSIGLGNPPPKLVNRFHAQGAKVIAMAATVDDAAQLADSGVDAIVAQGHEAGGHRSTWVKRPTSEHAHIGTMTLIPQVAEAVSVPVIAAGGISDGRGIVAALTLGAKGVLMGTRFVACRESLAPDFYKQALVEFDSDSTTVTDAFSGLFARVIRNTFTTEYESSITPVLPGFLQTSAARDIILDAAVHNNRDYFPMWAGQGIGLIRDVPDAGEIVSTLVDEVQFVMRSLIQSPGPV